MLRSRKTTPRMKRVSFCAQVASGFLKSREASTDLEYVPCLSLWKEVYGAVWFQTLLYTSHPQATIWRYLLILLIGVPSRAENAPKHLLIHNALYGSGELLLRSAHYSSVGGETAISTFGGL
jgi:hypothetical protein